VNEFTMTLGRNRKVRVQQNQNEKRYSIASAALGVLVAVAFIILPSVSASQSTTMFPDLEAGKRVYDETGTSLTNDQIADLEQQLDELLAVSADTIVYVRNLEATPNETLDQVEALQQAWVAETGVDQDNAVAILINRNPDDPNDARAGIYVGSTFDDGNVPPDEQRAIVDDALIPPLRDGDVYGSLAAGLTRLQSSIVNGPPQTRFERWSSSAADSWLPWAGLIAAITGFAGAAILFRRRQTVDIDDIKPTTTRPGDYSPALAGALATGGPQASALPATILQLATQNAIWIEMESEGSRWSKPTIQIRLVDQNQVQGDVQQLVWDQLSSKAESGVVSTKNLAKIAQNNQPLKQLLQNKMNEAGWTDPAATRNKSVLVIIVIIAVALAIFGFAVGMASGNWMPAIAVVALLVAALGAAAMSFTYSSLSRRGQEAAAPWNSYKEGLRQIAKDTSNPVDLDVVLPDAVAMNLGSKFDDRIKEAGEAGIRLRAFAADGSESSAIPIYLYVPIWASFSSSTGASGSSSGTVSAGGAGGGGGAAGST
jgi:uncharacterized membrane protein YgcG